MFFKNILLCYQHKLIHLGSKSYNVWNSCINILNMSGPIDQTGQYFKLLILHGGRPACALRLPLICGIIDSKQHKKLRMASTEWEKSFQLGFKTQEGKTKVPAIQSCFLKCPTYKIYMP